MKDAAGVPAQNPTAKPPNNQARKAHAKSVSVALATLFPHHDLNAGFDAISAMHEELRLHVTSQSKPLILLMQDDPNGTIMVYSNFFDSGVSDWRFTPTLDNGTH